MCESSTERRDNTHEVLMLGLERVALHCGDFLYTFFSNCMQYVYGWILGRHLRDMVECEGTLALNIIVPSSSKRIVRAYKHLVSVNLHISDSEYAIVH